MTVNFWTFLVENFELTASMICFDRRFGEGGKLLCLLIQHIGQTVDNCEPVKYNSEDDKLDKLKIVLQELRDDYLIQHLHRSLTNMWSLY